jgi:lipopolysaccharide/colanic/teichoic acid biosynthesis glycosyltransferase
MSVKEFAVQQIQVVGILAEEASMRGRAIQQKPVLGTVEELQDILRSLDVHGVTVDRIVVTSAAGRLASSTLESLSQVEKSSNIIVQFLWERLGFGVVAESPSHLSGQEQNSISRQSAAVARLESAIDQDHADSRAQSFWLSKRIVDVFSALSLMFVLTPVLALVTFIVALDVGFPVIFWQQRPGLHRRPFRLYKFRTMRAPHDKQGRRILDDQRSSVVGQILRRTRLDELPQLYNVLIGDMALIGPRPLLPRDQSADYAVRLSVRPGITGWAQVNGGRIISPSDKLMLDVWYVKNASFVLDLKIALRTVSMMLFGDRINAAAVAQARSHVSLKAPLLTEMVPAE